MYNKFNELIEEIFKELNKSKDLKSMCDFLCKCTAEYYPNVILYFGKKHGKRIEYIIGSSQDTLNFPQKIMITDDYYGFIENFDEFNEQQKNVFISLLKVVAHLKS